MIRFDSPFQSGYRACKQAGMVKDWTAEGETQQFTQLDSYQGTDACMYMSKFNMHVYALSVHDRPRS